MGKTTSASCLTSITSAFGQAKEIFCKDDLQLQLLNLAHKVLDCRLRFLLELILLVCRKLLQDLAQPVLQ